MNESSNSTMPKFQTLVHSERVARLPFGILLLVFYAIGIIGNSHVIHIFRNLPRRKTPSEAIILALAMFDIATNLVFIFKEYNRMRFVLVDNNEFICKLSNFSGFSAGLASAFFVLVLALYRYRRLFTPNTKETTVLFTVIKLLVCSLLAAILSIPVLFIIGHQIFHIGAFTVKRCWVDEEQVYEELPTIYFILLLCLSLFVSGISGFCNIRIIFALRSSKINLAKKGNAADKTTAHIELNAETVIEQTDFNSRLEATHTAPSKSPKANDACKTRPVLENKPRNSDGDCAKQQFTAKEQPHSDDECAKQQATQNEPPNSDGGAKQQASSNKAPNKGDDDAKQQATSNEAANKGDDAKQQATSNEAANKGDDAKQQVDSNEAPDMGNDNAKQQAASMVQQPHTNSDAKQQPTLNDIKQQNTNEECAKQQAIQIKPTNRSHIDATILDNRNNKNPAFKQKDGSPYGEEQGNENNDQMSYTKNGKKNEEVELQKSITFTVTILIISFTILLSYMLFLGLYLFVILKRKEPGFAVVSIREDTFYSYATDIVSLNAVVNPFVYFFSDPTYRKYVKSLYIRKRKRFEGSFRLISY